MNARVLRRFSIIREEIVTKKEKVIKTSVFRNRESDFFLRALIHKTFTHAYLQKGLRAIPRGRRNLKTRGIDN